MEKFYHSTKQEERENKRENFSGILKNPFQKPFIGKI